MRTSAFEWLASIASASAALLLRILGWLAACGAAAAACLAGAIAVDLVMSAGLGIPAWVIVAGAVAACVLLMVRKVLEALRMRLTGTEV
jgi:hypothetical protein